MPYTSSSLPVVPGSTPLPDPSKALQEFWSGTGANQTRTEYHNKSLATRRPQSFDKHLHEKLRLKRVVKIEAISSDLMNYASLQADAYPHPTLPPVNNLFIDHIMESQHRSRTAKDEDDISNEAELPVVYRGNVARGCMIIAATLAYGLTDWSQGCLDWSTSPQSEQVTGVKANQAKSDGFLNIVSSRNSTPLLLSDDQKRLVAKFPVLAIWEFKNLNFSENTKVMANVVDGYLNCWFPWEGCEFGDNCAMSHPTIGVTGCRMGYDLIEDHPCPSYQKAAQDAFDSSQLDPPPSSKESGLSSRHILQQAWTQAVRHDATFIIIRAGLMELICIRNRERQTLYVSNLFDIRTCKNYMKLQTGIYLAAIRDASGRVERLRVGPTLETWRLSTGLSEENKLDLTHMTKEISREAKTTGQTLFYTGTFLRTENLSDVLEDDPSVSRPSSQDLIAVEVSEEQAAKPSSDTLIQLITQIPFHPRICRATLQFPDVKLKRDFVRKDGPQLIVKRADDSTALKLLNNEYQTLKALHAANVLNIPTVYGFFTHVVDEFPATSSGVLLLKNMGHSLRQLKRKWLKAHNKKYEISNKLVKRLADTLDSIHKAGHLHGRLTDKNLMLQEGVPPNWDVSIVGFEYAVPLFAAPSSSQQNFTFDDEEMLVECGKVASAPLGRIEEVEMYEDEVAMDGDSERSMGADDITLEKDLLDKFAKKLQKAMEKDVINGAVYELEEGEIDEAASTQLLNDDTKVVPLEEETPEFEEEWMDFARAVGWSVSDLKDLRSLSEVTSPYHVIRTSF